jgi:pimeloyl-ACP methyl ester carboxylesterase
MGAVTIRKAYVGTSRGDVHCRFAGDGIPLVLLQLTPRASEQFEPSLDLFAAAGYRCVAIDLMGYGRSDKRDGAWSVPDFADNVREALSVLDIVPRALVAGHFSSLIALEMRVHLDVPIAALVLDGTPAWLPHEREDRRRSFREPPPWCSDGSHWPGFWDFAWGFMKRQEPALVLDATSEPCIRMVTAALLEAVFPPMPAAAMFDYDPLPLLARVKVPVLAITSRTDSLRACHARVIEAVPGATGHEFDSVHPLYQLAQVDRAGEYVAVVTDFLSRSLA